VEFLFLFSLRKLRKLDPHQNMMMHPSTKTLYLVRYEKNIPNENSIHFDNLFLKTLKQPLHTFTNKTQIKKINTKIKMQTYVMKMFKISI
jgi:hypothetical protein